MKGVHGNGQTFMGLLGDRAVGHGACLKAGYDRLHALHFLDGYALLRIVEVQKPSQISPVRLSINKLCIFLEHPVIAALCGLL